MADLHSLMEQARELSPGDRLRLAETLLRSIEPLDATVEKLWGAEGDARYEAYRRGELEAEDWETIRQQLEQ